jgi:glycosyltransferase 2 family protein
MTTLPNRKGNTLSSRFLGLVRRLLPWVAVGCVVFALLPRANELRLCLSRMSGGYLEIALALCMTYWFLNAGVWAWILEALGHPIPYVTGMRVWLTSESLRWLPGSIWGFCSRVDAARRLGVPVAVASISLPVELGVVVGSWGIVAVGGLAVSGLGIRLVTLGATWIVPSLAILLVLLIAGRVVWPIMSRQPWFEAGLERFKAILNLDLKPPALIRSGLVYALLNAAHGFGFWLMLAGMGYQHSVNPAAAVGANAAGWLLGFFAIGVPGGIGVREAGAALLLSPIMPWHEAVLAAGLWRVLQIVAELAALLPWLIFGGGETRARLNSLAEERS